MPAWLKTSGTLWWWPPSIPLQFTGDFFRTREASFWMSLPVCPHYRYRHCCTVAGIIIACSNKRHGFVTANGSGGIDNKDDDPTQHIGRPIENSTFHVTRDRTSDKRANRRDAATYSRDTTLPGNVRTLFTHDTLFWQPLGTMVTTDCREGGQTTSQNGTRRV